MQCIACKQSISFFRRACPYCSYDQRLQAFAGVRAEENETDEDSKESEDHLLSTIGTAIGTDSREIEGYEFALKGCRFYIGLQRAFIEAEHAGSLPEKARDQFSLGYLSGVVDAWMQALSVENESLRMTALGKVFEDIFGSDGEACLLEALSQMHSADASYMNGMRLGGNDAFESIRQGLSGGGSIPKLTWAQHVSS